MRSDASRVVVLFDLDGTLIPWDTQLLFYNFVVKHHGWRRLLIIPFCCCLPLVGLLGEGRMKKLFLAYLWRMSRTEIRRLASAFVENSMIPILYEELMERLRGHQRKGDFCVLTTASPDIYASVFSEKLGFDCFFATDVLYGDRMTFYPHFPHGNNKGEVKVARLKESGVLGDTESFDNVIAYSDSSADLPMLEFSFRRVLVNPSNSLVGSFSKESCEILRPDRPWHSRGGKMLGILRQLLGICHE